MSLMHVRAFMKWYKLYTSNRKKNNHLFLSIKLRLSHLDVLTWAIYWCNNYKYRLIVLTVLVSMWEGDTSDQNDISASKLSNNSVLVPLFILSRFVNKWNLYCAVANGKCPPDTSTFTPMEQFPMTLQLSLFKRILFIDNSILYTPALHVCHQELMYYPLMFVVL